MINILPGVESTSAALNAERIRMDVISQNIANVNTTHGPDGKPYQRQHVVFETVLQQQQAGDANGHAELVQVSKIVKDHRAPKMIYNPGHPDADAGGMVAIPNINRREKMLNLTPPSLSFKPNLAV